MESQKHGLYAQRLSAQCVDTQSNTARAQFGVHAGPSQAHALWDTLPQAPNLASLTLGRFTLLSVYGFLDRNTNPGHGRNMAMGLAHRQQTAPAPHAQTAESAPALPALLASAADGARSSVMACSAAAPSSAHRTRSVVPATCGLAGCRSSCPPCLPHMRCLAVFQRQERCR